MWKKLQCCFQLVLHCLVLRWRQQSADHGMMRLNRSCSDIWMPGTQCNYRGGVRQSDWSRRGWRRKREGCGEHQRGGDGVPASGDGLPRVDHRGVWPAAEQVPRTWHQVDPAAFTQEDLSFLRSIFSIIFILRGLVLDQNQNLAPAPPRAPKSLGSRTPR